MTQPTRAQIIAAAVALLRSGVPPPALAVRLMAEYGLSQTLARELAWAAVKQWREQKPPSSESNGVRE